ncbi:hypothetical protein C8Q76DRAFT_722496 [Earliella scabrosa]|nr:hypothetical protein C8Q76DRAFT_722496 [Earliella scabrosa]
MSHSAYADYAVLRPKVLNLANDSTVPDDVLNIWYNNALAVLDDPENVQYLSLFIGTMMGGTTKDVFQLMHSSASTFGATGGTRYVCAAVVTHAKAAAALPPSLGESAGKRVARALRALALLWANSMVHLCNGEDGIGNLMVSVDRWGHARGPIAADVVREHFDERLWAVLERDGFTCTVTGKSHFKSASERKKSNVPKNIDLGKGPVPIHIFHQSVAHTTHSDDPSDTLRSDLLKYFCQCADPTVDVNSLRNTFLLDSSLTGDFQYGSFTITPSGIPNQYRLAMAEVVNAPVHALQSRPDKDLVTFTDHSHKNHGPCQPSAELPSGDLLRAHAMMTMVLRDTVLRLQASRFASFYRDYPGDYPNNSGKLWSFGSKLLRPFRDSR